MCAPDILFFSAPCSLLLLSRLRQGGTDELWVTTELDAELSLNLCEQGDVRDRATGFVVGNLWEGE